VSVKPGQAPLSFFEKLETLLKKRFRRLVKKRKFFSPHTIYESRAEFPTGLARELLQEKADLFVLNWLGNRTISIREIGRLGQRAVCQLHDMWMFSGAEHYRFDDRASVGHSRKSRPPEETGPDLNKRNFRLKRKYWRRPVSVIVPSRWLESEVKESALTADWPVYVLPYPVDTNFWQPRNPIESRRALGFSDDDLIVMFGAVGGTGAHHKGGDLLLKSLEILSENNREFPLPKERVRVAIFGESSEVISLGGFDARFLGRLSDEQLRLAFSAASVLVVPSRLGNFALIGLWGHACGAPEVVFEGTGMTDIVEHGITGYHARKDDPHYLAACIHSVLANKKTQKSFSRAARARALDLWREDTVAEQYAEILHNIARKL
jgi:glycosyltransferase involved in cell wall biosynthesis